MCIRRGSRAGDLTVDATRLAALLRSVDDDRRNGADVGERLCATCVEVLGVAGAGIMLMSEGEHRGTLGVSNAVISVVEELQFTLGEGPCIDAYNTTLPVFEPDLGEPAVNRWPAFSGPAVDAGVGAVFGFPLRAGAANLGALDLYLADPADLLPHQVDDATVMAEVISATVLSLQADAAPGTLAPELRAGLAHRSGVHQASGMVSAQLDIDVADALTRIRAHAYTTNRPINDVARDIVARRLRLA